MSLANFRRTYTQNQRNVEFKLPEMLNSCCDMNSTFLEKNLNSTSGRDLPKMFNSS